MMILLLLPILNLFIKFVYADHEWTTTAGWATPQEEIILKQGTPLEINCTLDYDRNRELLDRGYTSEEMIFDNGNFTIDKKYITLVNKTTAKLHIDNLPITENNTFYYCRIIVYDIDHFSLHQSTIVDGIDENTSIIYKYRVSIGVQPRKVNEFKCVIRNWVNLTCTWHEPNNGVFTTYESLIWLPREHNNTGTSWYHCPVIEINDGISTCQCMLHDIGRPRIGELEFLRFMVNGTNKFGHDETIIEFPHRDNVIPAPASKLAYFNATPHSVYIQWNRNIANNFSNDLVYRISQKPNADSEENWYVVDDSGIVEHYNDIANTSARSFIIKTNEKYFEKFDDTIRVKVNDLSYPNTTYNLTIEMKTIPTSDIGFWSDPASFIVETSPCHPYHSPETTIGGFKIFNQMQYHRDVVIFWKRIKKLEQNAGGFRYEITVFEDDLELNIIPNIITDSYATYADLLSDSEYKFYIKSINIEGSAPYSSVIRVPKKQDILPNVLQFTKRSFGNGVYELVWESDANTNDSKITNYTIFWCESNQENLHYCSNISWTHLSNITTKINFTSCKQNIDHQFAISVNSGNLSSGMKWASCIPLDDQPKSVENVWIAELGQTYIGLRWKLSCSERIKDIRGYNITYCPINDTNRQICAHPEKTFLVYGDANVGRADITGLQIFTEYNVSVAIFTENQLGPASKMMTNRTLQGVPDMTGVEVKVSDITNVSAVIKWNAPIKLNGLLNRYEVCYNKEKIITNDTEIMLTNLISYTDYNVSVFACTVACSESTKQVYFVTKISAPSKVEKIRMEQLNQSNIILKWDPPMILAGPSPKYDVILRICKLDGNVTFNVFETNETEAIVGIPGKTIPSSDKYQIMVRAKNVADSSLPSIVEYYFGPWSEAGSSNDDNSTIFSTIMQNLTVIILSLVVLLILFGFAVFFVSKKRFCKCSSCFTQDPAHVADADTNHKTEDNLNTTHENDQNESKNATDNETDVFIKKSNSNRSRINGSDLNSSSENENESPELELCSTRIYSTVD